VLSSKKHSSIYVRVKLLSDNADIMYNLGEMLADRIVADITNKRMPLIDGVVGARTMGQELALMTALCIPFHVCRLWCNMNDGVASWPDNMDFADKVSGKNFFIVDDVRTTGKASRGVTKLIESYGGNVVGEAYVADRSTGSSEGDFIYLLKDGADLYDPDDCPMCHADPPVPMREQPGHGAEWLELHPFYPVAD
jgi:orotate phosphoribosyltransferase